MKVVLDECVPQRWCAFLAASGHTAILWATAGGAGQPDAALVDWAAANTALILTCDSDIGQILWRRQTPTPGVVQLGAPHWTPETHGDTVVAALRECERQLPRCYFVRIAAVGAHHKFVALPFGPV